MPTASGYEFPFSVLARLEGVRTDYDRITADKHVPSRDAISRASCTAYRRTPETRERASNRDFPAFVASTLPIIGISLRQISALPPAARITACNVRRSKCERFLGTHQKRPGVAEQTRRPRVGVWYFDVERAARGECGKPLRQCRTWIVKVFEHMTGDDEVEILTAA